MNALTVRGTPRKREYPTNRVKRDATPLERVLHYVSVNDATGCWEWQASLRNGYGTLTIHYKAHYAHRVAYEALVGPIPEGLQLDHLCRNPPCCNPAHLEPVTAQVNTLRGTGFAATNAVKTHCSEGHPYDEVNTYHHDGRRQCRQCVRARVRALYDERRQQIIDDPSLAPHGDHRTYSGWKCRCIECKAAWSAYQRECYQRRKADRIETRRAVADREVA